jgi:putative tryptophan/tyrosine transport system substrate-binding protein
MPRLCFLTFDPGTLDTNRFKPFLQGLRDLAYTAGQTITVDYMSADGQGDRFPTLAAECLRLNADVMIVTTTLAAQAAKNATCTIPIVMIPLGDPAATGIVASLSRPWGQYHGTDIHGDRNCGQASRVAKGAVPRISRVLVLSYLADPKAAPQVNGLERAAGSLGVKLLLRDIRSADDLPAAFDAGARDGIGGN